MQQRVISYGGNRFILEYHEEEQVVYVAHMGTTGRQIIGDIQLAGDVCYRLNFASGGEGGAPTLRKAIEALCERFMMLKMDGAVMNAEFRAIGDTI